MFELFRRLAIAARIGVYLLSIWGILSNSGNASVNMTDIFEILLMVLFFEISCRTLIWIICSCVEFFTGSENLKVKRMKNFYKGITIVNGLKQFYIR